jgi:uncharacterized protein YggE
MFKNRIVGWFAVAFLALALVACTSVQAAPQPTSASSAEGALRTITVVGIGEVTLVPDIARINIGAEARSESVAAAKAEVDRQMAAIVAALQELGIAEKDIQTTNYSIYFEREPVPVVREGPTEEGQGMYRVSNMVQVTVREVEQAGEVLDAVVQAGANQVFGVNFTISDRALWEGQAREKAMADAKARAEDLARLAGAKLGQVLTISEVIGSTPVPVMAERAYGGGGIAPGELEMSTQVQVTYAIQ